MAGWFSVSTFPCLVKIEILVQARLSNVIGHQEEIYLIKAVQYKELNTELSNVFIINIKFLPYHYVVFDGVVLSLQCSVCMGVNV